MSKTIIDLVIPFTFASERNYEISVKGIFAIISIEYVENNKVIDEIMGIESEGKITLLPDDPQGSVNISKIKIELPYLLDQNNSVIDEARRCSLTFLNRLEEVIRFTTNRYWLRSISEKELNVYNVEVKYDNEKGRRYFRNGPFPAGYKFKIPIFEESKVKEKINDMIRNETPIPLSINLYLDALSYSNSGRFVESIIVANMALEVYVAEYLKTKYRNEGTGDDEVRKIVNDFFDGKFHKTMKKAFFAGLDENALKSNPMWIKFDNARNKRTKVIHRESAKISFNESEEVLIHIGEILAWIQEGARIN